MRKSFQSWKRLRQHSQSAVTLSLFACEIGLKGLLTAPENEGYSNYEKVIKEHKIKSLFEQLKAEEMDYLISKSSEISGTRWDKDVFDCLLD